MTDKIKKLEPLNEDVKPEFPSNRGGYVEDEVDNWLHTHLKEVNAIITYQNYGVDVVDSLENELAEANARLQEIQDSPLVVQTENNEDSEGLKAELERVKAELEEAKNEAAEATARLNHQLENASPLDSFPTIESETIRASILLQHATKLGAEYIENAKADGEQIRRDAENRLVEVRGEIEMLEAQRFATYRTLEDFFSTELSKLRQNEVFAPNETEEDAAGDKDVSVKEIPADVLAEEELEAEIQVAETEGLPIEPKKDEKTVNNAETKGSAK